jgi:hypothetical protein
MSKDLPCGHVETRFGDFGTCHFLPKTATCKREGFPIVFGSSFLNRIRILMYIDVSCMYPEGYMYLECILMYLKCILHAH